MEHAIAIPEALLAELESRDRPSGRATDDDTSSTGSLDSWDDYFTFEIEIETDPPPVSQSLEMAHREAKVVKLTHGPVYRFNSKGDHREITGPELESIAHPYSQITLCYSRSPQEPLSHEEDSKKGDDGPEPINLKETYVAKNGVYFTLSDLVETLVKFETKARNHRRIGGLIDLTHTSFRSLIPLNHVDDGDLLEFEVCFD